MYDQLNDSDIVDCVRELVKDFGVRDDIDPHSLLMLLKQDKDQECIASIAVYLGLPIKVQLSYMSTDNDSEMTTESLQPAYEVPMSIGGKVAAKIFIPKSIPEYGSTALVNFPINVHITRGCHKQPETFITCIAHELSHVLLQSMRSSKSSAELYVDLLPMVFGFTLIIEKGRKVISTTSDWDEHTTQTTTYGYLSDSQFCCARDAVHFILDNHLKNKNQLLLKIRAINKAVCRMIKIIDQFKRYLESIDKKHDVQIKKDDVSEIVLYHSCDYTREWGELCNKANGVSKSAAEFASQLVRFTTQTPQEIEGRIQMIDNLQKSIQESISSIHQDIRRISKYVDWHVRLRSLVIKGRGHGRPCHITC